MAPPSVPAGKPTGGGETIGHVGPLPTDPEELVRLLLDNTITASISAVGVVAGGFATRLGTKVSKAISKLRKKKAGKPKLKGKRRDRKKERDKKNQKACRKRCGCYQCQTAEDKRQIRQACKKQGGKGSCPVKHQCFAAGTRVGDGAIEDVQLGSEQSTWRVGEHGFAGYAPELMRVREREVWLGQEIDGGRAEVEFLRGEEWFAERGVSAVGDWTLLDLPELSLKGRFQVVELGEVEERIFVRRPGYGRVTGRFRFSRGETVNLFVEGESAPIGVTGGHPV